MITYVLGDLFTSPASMLVNTVNTVGVMGKGLAKEFKAYFPEMFDEYQKLCEDGRLTIGRLYLYRSLHKSVLNFPTKRHWRQKSRIEDIEAGLRTFASHYTTYGITDIAFPQLGCGNGELDWETQVQPLMEQYLSALPIEIYIHIYDVSSVPEHRNVAKMKQWLRSEPASMSFQEVLDDLRTRSGAHASHDGWVVSVGEEEYPNLTFIQDGRLIAVSYEEGLDLWQQLRSFGFLELRDVPSEHRDIAEPLFDAFRTLPYIQPIRFASGSDRNHFFTKDLLEQREEAIQLVPLTSATGSSAYKPLALPLLAV